MASPTFTPALLASKWQADQFADFDACLAETDRASHELSSFGNLPNKRQEAVETAQKIANDIINVLQPKTKTKVVNTLKLLHDKQPLTSLSAALFQNLNKELSRDAQPGHTTRYAQTFQTFTIWKDLEFHSPDSRAKLVQMINQGARLSQVGINNVADICRFLSFAGQELTYLDVGFVDGDLLELLPFDQLRSLTFLSVSCINDRIAAAIAGLSRLENLEFSSGPNLTLAGFVHLAQMSQLRRMHWKSFGNETDQALKIMAGLPLEVLRIDFGSLSGAGLKQIGRLTPLRELHLHSVPLSDAEMADFPKLENLEGLTLDLCYNLTRGCFSFLRGQDTLQRLTLNLYNNQSVPGARLFFFPLLRELSTNCLTDRDGADLARHSQLTALNLHNCELTGKGFADLPQSLRSLSLKSCTHVTEDNFSSVCRLPNLLNLQVEGCPQLSSASIRAMNAAYPAPQTMTDVTMLLDAFSINPDPILPPEDPNLDRMEIDDPIPPPKVPNLERMSPAQSLQHYPTNAWLGLAAQSPTLNADLVQRINGGLRICDLGVKDLATLGSFLFANRENIVHLDLSYLDGMDLASLPHKQLNSLRSLIIHSIKDPDAAAIAGLGCLETLALLSTHDLTPAGFTHLARMTHLRGLHLQSLSVDTNQALEMLAGISLEALKIDFCNLSATGLKQIGRLNSLRELHLHSVPLSEADMADFPELEKLDSLSLNFCPNLTKACLGSLTRLRHLRQLTFYLHDFQSVLAARLDLSHFPLLQQLVTNCLTDQDCANLASLHHLITLYLNSCNELTGEGFAFFPRSLRSLTLKHCKNAEDSYFPLSKLINLEETEITGCPKIDLTRDFASTPKPIHSNGKKRKLKKGRLD